MLRKNLREGFSIAQCAQATFHGIKYLYDGIAVLVAEKMRYLT